MAADWPTVADVKDYLRLLGTDTTDDNVVGWDLAAAIAWVTEQVQPQWVLGDPTNDGTLPDPLFSATVKEAGRLYRRRDSVDGTVGWGDQGLVRVGSKDPDINSLMAPYLAIVFG